MTALPLSAHRVPVVAGWTVLARLRVSRLSQEPEETTAIETKVYVAERRLLVGHDGIGVRVEQPADDAMSAPRVPEEDDVPADFVEIGAAAPARGPGPEPVTSQSHHIRQSGHVPAWAHREPPI